MFELAYVEQAASYDQIEEIRIEGTACLGPCPQYIVSVQPDDAYLFCGFKFANVVGPQPGRLPEGSFLSLLQTLRENEYLTRNSVDRGGDNCTSYFTDGPGARISVSFTNGEFRQLYWYAGCQVQVDGASTDSGLPYMSYSDDALALSAITGHARELLIAEGLLWAPESMPPIPREVFWNPGFPREECGFDE